MTAEIISQEASSIMKQALVLATLIVAVCGGKWVPGLRSHFNTGFMGFGFGRSFMYGLPKTESEAKDADWKLQTRPANGYLPKLNVMYCHSPPVMCVVYDDNGFAALLQISISKLSFTNSAYDMHTQGFIDWTDSNGNDYWTAQLLLVSEDYLAIDKAERLASHISGNVLQQDSVWVVGTNHELYTIPNNTVDIAKTDFTVQACIPWMGLHYYYKMTPDTKCSAETLLPWFPMYDAGELVGVGLMTYGRKADLANGEREWFEHPDKSAIKLIVKNGPTCLHNLGDSPGAHTMHIYFVDNPRLILCLNN